LQKEAIFYWRIELLIYQALEMFEIHQNSLSFYLRRIHQLVRFNLAFLQQFCLKEVMKRRKTIRNNPHLFARCGLNRNL
jgi:hypothetical protein